MKRSINRSLVRVVGTLGLIALCSGLGQQAQATTNPVPYIVNLSPTTVAPGSAQFTLTVYGANFVTGSTVVWGTHQGSAKLTTTLVSSDELTAAVPASELTNAGTAYITVKSPSGVVSNETYLTVTLPTTSLAFRRTVQSPSGGNHPNVPIFGDFTGDGILDLAVSNNQSTAGQVSVFTGNGDGSFSAATNYTVASACGTGGAAPCDPEGMVAGDFNGDGYLDLAVVNMGDSSVTILLGSASGTFTVSTPMTIGTQPYAIATADFNQDGNLDLAIACQGPSGGPGYVDILLGNGDGTFAAPVQYGSIGQPEGIALADFNSDGYLDLAVSDFTNNEVWILSGNGNGTFSSGTSYATALEPAGVVANDFNGDGYTDLVVADLESNAVSVLLNNSGGGFHTHVDYPVAGGGYFLASADLNGSGIPGLAVANFTSNVFSSLFSNTSEPGTFQSYTSYTIDPNADSVFGLALADVNSDGRYDVVTTDTPDNVVEVLLQTATLNPSPSSLTFPSTGLGDGSTPQTIVLANTGSAPLVISQISSLDPKDFPQSNTCGTLPVTLWVGDSCTVTVTFTPSAEGNLASSINVDDNVASGGTQTVPVAGVGLASEATLAPGLTFSNQFEGTVSTAQTVTLTNKGNAALNVSSIAVTAGYQQTNTCGASLAANSSCSISVSFKPTALGASSGTLTVTDNANGASNATQTVALNGTGIGPTAAIAPAGLTFASQLVNTTSPTQSITLNNAGSAALTITSIVIGGNNAGDFAQTNNCGTSLAASASCAVTVSFKPVTTGSLSASVTVTDNANGVSGSSQVASLTGTGLGVPTATVSGPPAFAATLVGTSSSAASVTVSNTGSAALSIVGIAIAGANSSDFGQTNNCGTSLVTGSSCAISLIFTPSSTGTRSATLTITDNNNAVSGSAQTVSLSGSGIQPAVKLSASSVSFPNENVGTASTVQPITITNTGSAALALTSITASGDFSVSNPCGTSMAVGGSCTVNLTFKPTAMGSRTGALTISDDAVPGTQTVSLSGTGLGAEASLSGSSLTFGAELVGVTSASQTVTLKNIGNAALALTSIAAGGDFAATNTCGSSLAAGASCSVSVTFAAKAGGARSGTLTLADSALGGNQTVALSGTGQDFSLTASSSSANVSPGQTASYTLTLTPSASFNEAVSLSCTGLASNSQASCSVSPSSVSPSGATPVTVTVTTTAASHLLPISRPNPPLPGGQGEWLFVALVLSLAGMTWLAKRRPQLVPVRMRLALVTACIAAILALGMTACGGGGSSITSTSNVGTPAGNYSITVSGSATSGTVTDNHKVALTMAVQ